MQQRAGPGSWDTATYVRDPKGAPGSWLRLAQLWLLWSSGGVSQQMEGLSLWTQAPVVSWGARRGFVTCLASCERQESVYYGQ